MDEVMVESCHRFRASGVPPERGSMTDASTEERPEIAQFSLRGAWLPCTSGGMSRLHFIKEAFSGFLRARFRVPGFRVPSAWCSMSGAGFLEPGTRNARVQAAFLTRRPRGQFPPGLASISGAAGVCATRVDPATPNPSACDSPCRAWCRSGRRAPVVSVGA